MARITVEDCLGTIENRFNLILTASKRARQLAFGEAFSKIPEENDKYTVIALREIAGKFVDQSILDERSDS